MPTDPKTQEPIRAWAVVCKDGKLHSRTIRVSLVGAHELAGMASKSCGPHRVVELREVRDGE